MNESCISFLINRLPELIQKIYEQLFLAGTGIIFAILVSVPVGIWVARNKKIRGPVLAAVNILQTIPSLAVLAFLIPFVGIGAKPAIITLTIYALLPIVRNTASGILTISPVLIEAADSLGLTKYQKLTRVELPLAFPSIMVGIRTATTLCVGTATLAAFVGGGGLGDFIYQGLSLNNNRLIMLGAIPAALLVLVLDFLLAHIENILNRKKRREPKKRNVFKTAAVASVVVLFMIKPVSFLWATCNHNVIRIGARSDPEQMIMGEIIAQSLEKNTNLKVVRKFNFVSPSMAQSAVEHQQMDVFPEYTGTAYVATLHGDFLHRPKDFSGYVRNAYQKKYQLTWLPEFGFNNSNAVLLPKKVATSKQIKTISDLRRYATKFNIGVPSDFFLRDDGYKGLHDVYHLNFKDIKLMQINLLISAIHNHFIQLAMGASTDGRIESENLVVLEDDKHIFPEYKAAPVIRNDVLARHPEIKTALAPVLGRLTDEKMRELNYQVEVEKRSVTCVVKGFLVEVTPTLF